MEAEEEPGEPTWFASLGKSNQAANVQLLDKKTLKRSVTQLYPLDVSDTTVTQLYLLNVAWTKTIWIWTMKTVWIIWMKTMKTIWIPKSMDKTTISKNYQEMEEKRRSTPG